MILHLPKSECYIVPSGIYEGKIVGFYPDSKNPGTMRLKYELPSLETPRKLKVAASSFTFDDRGHSSFFTEIERLFPELFEGLSPSNEFDTDVLIGKRLMIEIEEIDKYQNGHKHPYSKVNSLMPLEHQAPKKSKRTNRGK